MHGGREKKRGDGGKESLFLGHGQLGKGSVCAKIWNMLKRCACYLFSSPPAFQYLPSSCVVSTLSQRLAGAAGENGRKSDPYGGTIKLLADFRASSKPGHYSWLASSSHTWSLRPEHLTLSSAATAFCLIPAVPQQQSSKLLLLLKVICFRAVKWCLRVKQI